MQTKNLIQMQANVVKITSLKTGDVIKILEKEYSDTYKCSFGIVIDMLNNGKDTFVTILQYQIAYNEITTSIKTYSGSMDLNIFPAKIEEVKISMKDAISSFEKEVEKSEKELIEEKLSLKKLIEFVEGETSKQLTEASFLEITQKEYDKKMKLE